MTTRRTGVDSHQSVSGSAGDQAADATSALLVKARGSGARDKGWEVAEAGPRSTPLWASSRTSAVHPETAPGDRLQTGFQPPRDPHCHAPGCGHDDELPPHRQNPHLIQTAKDLRGSERLTKITV